MKEIFTQNKVIAAFETALQNVVGEVAREMPITLEKPKQVGFGDLALTTCLAIFSRLCSDHKKALGSPLQLAGAVVKEAGDLTALGVAKIEVLPPGFINLTLSDQAKWVMVARMLKSEVLTDKSLGAGKNVVIDYSSPNIAKPFTIGHLRSTIIGDAVANLLEASGYQVHRDNHLGDWGTQFGKQIVAIEKWGNLAEIEASDEPIKELVALYVKFHEEAKEHPELDDEARATFKALEDGDNKITSMWQKCVDLSLKEFDRIYARLGVAFTENGGKGYGESFATPYIEPILAELKKKNLLQESKGAQVVFFPEESKLPPMIVIKEDGATIYATRDLAIDYFKLQHYGRPLIEITEAGMEQNLYFRQLIKTEEMLGWFAPGERVHLGHGLYRFKDRKMSTRKGDVIWLEDVLNEAHERVRAMSKPDLPDDTVEAIAIGATKWNDLSRETTKNIDFDFDEILNIKGFSGPYLQYALVRIVAILSKILEDKNGDSVADILQESSEKLLNNDKEWQLVLENGLTDDEKVLVNQLLSYQETISKATLNYVPHILCDYLYTLATNYNSFYAAGKIAGEKKRELLTLLTGRVLHEGLAILGIKSLTQM